MTVREKKQLKILMVLLVILGVALYMSYGMNRTPAVPQVASPAEQRAEAALPSGGGARIRLDLMKPDDKDGDVGRNNLFQYRKPPAPPAPQIQSAPPPIQAPPANPQWRPPPPPPIAFKYEGWGQVNGKLTAFLSYDANGRPTQYNATEGEVLMGRYRVARVAESVVEIEDLESKRRQIFPRAQQE